MEEWAYSSSIFDCLLFVGQFNSNIFDVFERIFFFFGSWRCCTQSALYIYMLTHFFIQSLFFCKLYIQKRKKAKLLLKCEEILYYYIIVNEDVNGPIKSYIQHWKIWEIFKIFQISQMHVTKFWPPLERVMMKTNEWIVMW